MSLNIQTSISLVHTSIFFFKHLSYTSYEWSKHSSLTCNISNTKFETHSKWMQLDLGGTIQAVSIQAKHPDTFHRVQESYSNHQTTSENTLSKNLILTWRGKLLNFELFNFRILLQILLCHLVSALILIINPQSIA